MAPARGNFKVRALKALEINSMELYAIHRHYNVIDGRPARSFLPITVSGALKEVLTSPGRNTYRPTRAD
jgi:hypothetical protein